MTVVWLVARAHLRRHWRSAAIVALLAGLAGAAVLATADGVRRTRTAVPRFLEATRFPDVFVVLQTGDGGGADPDDLAAVEGLPGVEAIAPVAGFVLVPADVDLPPGRETQFMPWAGIDERHGRDVHVPRIVEGRRPDASRSDEIVVTEATAAALGLRAGDTTRFVSLTPEQLEQVEQLGTDPGPPAGPELELRVVGVARDLGDVAAGVNLDDFPIVATPALYEQHGSAIATFGGVVLVRLEPDAEPAAFLEAFEQAVGDRGFASGSDPGDLGGLQQPIDTESVALGALGLVVALAGVVAAGQALARQHGLAAAEAPTLRALGVGARPRALAGVLAAVPTAVAAAAVTVAGAVAMSPWLPLGVAGRADPRRGVVVDPPVLALGALAVAGLVVGLSTVTAWRSARHGETVARPARRSVLAGQLTQVGASPPAEIGVRMALEAGRGRTAVPVRSAMAGTAVAVMGLVAALVVGASLDRLLDDADRYGWPWDVTVSAGTSGDPARARELAGALVDRSEVEATAVVTTGLVRVEDRLVWGLGFEAGYGDLAPTMVAGRAPQTNDEIALGSETLDRAGRSIGDTVMVGPAGSQQPMRIVGRVVMPRIDNDEPARGAIVAGDLGRLEPRSVGEEGEGQVVVVRFSDGADAEVAVAALQDAGHLVTADLRPVDIDTLAQVRSLPFVLAATLATLGLLGLGHALLITVRRRRRELAVLAGLGLLRRQVQAVLAWQATTVGLVGVVVGLPLGLIGGRWGWGALARGLGVADDPLIPVAVLALVVVLVPALAVAVAAGPSWLATRAHPAEILRSE